jgi:DNA-binding MarR family transcriptional regulator
VLVAKCIIASPTIIVRVGLNIMAERDLRTRDTLRAIFDLIMLAEPAQAALWHSHRLTLTQLGAIRVLSEGSLPAGKLAHRLAMSPTSLTRMLDRLEARRLIERLKDDDDRRKVTIRLLPAGSNLLDGISVLAGTAMHEAVTAMSAEDQRKLLVCTTSLVAMTRARSVRARAVSVDAPVSQALVL